MKYKELIEMPVAGIHADLQHVDSPVRFRTIDKNKIASKDFYDLVTKKLKYVPFDLYIYFVDTAHTRANIPIISTRDIDDERYYSLFYNLNNNDDVTNLSKLQIDQIIKNFEHNKDAVHLVISHNDPEANEWIGLSPWMILHRLGHAIFDKTQRAADELPVVKRIHKIWPPYLAWHPNHWADGAAYSIEKAVLSNLKSVSSSRGLDAGEGLIEMFVSFCLNGNISFKTVSDPATRSHVFRLVRNLDLLFDELINELKGKVWTG